MAKKSPWTSPSEMRLLVVIETPIKTTDDAGEDTIDRWDPVPSNTNGEHFIKLFGLGGSEIIEAGRQGMVLSHTAALHFVEGLTSEMRLRVVGSTPTRVLNIVTIQDWQEQQREHRLLLKEAP